MEDNVYSGRYVQIGTLFAMKDDMSKTWTVYLRQVKSDGSLNLTYMGTFNTLQDFEEWALQIGQSD